MKLYEIQVTIKGQRDEQMFALMGANSEWEALQALYAVWGPPGEISNVTIREVKKYFAWNLIPREIEL